MALLPAQMNRSGVVRQKAFYDDALKQYIPVVAIEGGGGVSSTVTLGAGSNLAGKFILVANGVDVAAAAPLPVGIDAAALASLALLDDIVAATGAALGSVKLALMGGSDGTNLRALLTTAAGLLRTEVSVGGAAVAAANPLFTSSPGSLNELSATLTRLGNTTTYITNGLIAPNAGAAAGNAIPLTNAVLQAGDGFRVERCCLGKSTNASGAPNFRVFLWRSQPTFTGIGDNGNLNAITTLLVDDITRLIDYFDVTMDKFGSTAGSGAAGVGLPASGNPVIAKPASGTTLYYSLQSLGNYIPGSGEVFTPRFEGSRA